MSEFPKYAKNTKMRFEAGALDVLLSPHTGGVEARLARVSGMELLHFQHTKPGGASEFGNDEFNALKFAAQNSDGAYGQEVYVYLTTAQVGELRAACAALLADVEG